MTFLQDLRHGLRMLMRSPGSSAVVVIVLAIGIGANGTIFLVANEAFLRDAPFVKDPDRLVAFCFTEDGRQCGGFTHPEYIDLRDRSRAFSSLITYRATPLNLSGPSAPVERVAGAIVSGNYFSVLGVNLARGRSFLAAEDRTPGTHPVAILGYALWQRRFGGDPALVGGAVSLNGAAFTVVGIAAEGFQGPELFDPIDVWIPVMMEKQARPFLEALGNRRFHVLQVAGRLADGVGLEQAQSEMSVLGRHVAQASENLSDRRKRIRLFRGIRMAPELRSEALRLVEILTGIAGFVLLIACANVANFLLARAVERRREIAVRLALGSRRGRLIRQLLTEGMVLALLAGVAGVLLCVWTGRLLNLLDWGQGLDFRVDSRVLVFTALVSFLAALLFGLAPALHASNPDLVPALKEGSPGGGLRRSRLRGLLVVVQMALSLVLLAGTGLLLRAFTTLRAANPGFDPHNIVLMPVDLRIQGYSEARAMLFYSQLMERAASVPGVESVAVAETAPLGWIWDSDVIIEGRETSVTVDRNRVTPGYFGMLHIPVLRGRDFTNHDNNGTAPVCLVNEAVANRFWPGEDPLTKRLRLVKFFGPGPFVQVVGVVKDTRHRGLDKAHVPLLYLPFAQEGATDMTLLVRTAQDPAGIVPGLRKQLLQLDRGLPVPEIKTLRQQVAGSLVGPRDNAILVGVFGLLAVFLAATGLYAVMSYAVAQRRHEIGVRMAMGAQRMDVLKIVVRQGMKLALFGNLCGLLASLALTRALSSELYGISPTDPITFLGAVALLTLVAFAACWAPALRATRVDPAAALRNE